ncbi:phospholipase B1, membrane-associated-like isoform X2 [Anopheles albimanus]|uniref:phospholipase B1, membrane-associated-like isoform X2 n=1 Tax=Anopheles albimanus TaxID=7167 RepID=UPI00163DFCAD|nr:phospholipase B1, membrane-associated-like isoform X2 [Anopheles albimanus]
MMRIRLLASLLTLLAAGQIMSNAQEEVTILDSPPLLELYRGLQRLQFNYVKPNSEDATHLTRARKLGKIQTTIPEEKEFPCSTEGMRSPQVPTSVHELRPGDIDVVAAMGDSQTAGTGAIATEILELAIDNRGLSWSIGGQGTWREYLTIPNILKEFNPKLNGYALADSLSNNKSSRFNVAQIGSMSADLTHQARNLIKRMLSDRTVDIKNHWKLVTIFMGHNDFCSRICYLTNPEKALGHHEKNLIEAIRLLRKYLPGTMVNIVSPISEFLLLSLLSHHPSNGLAFLSCTDVNVLRTFRPLPPECVPIHRFACFCIFGTRFRALQPRLNRIIHEWSQVQRRVAERPEFQNVTDFTVNYQPFPEQWILLPTLADGSTDTGLASVDCFHFSQRGHALFANSYWNNMIEVPVRTWRRRSTVCVDAERCFDKC